ncbi:MAG: hypothetical protein PHF50_01085 [Patescibacteria group bacterium]|nr:hypothetical protein [Patescibacteria group bacterium]
MCRYKNYCKFPGGGCNAEDEDNCPDAIDLYASLCPLLAVAGVAKINCACDIPQIRKLWPAEKKCFEGQDCLPRKYRPVQVQIQKITDPASITAAFSAA